MDAKKVKIEAQPLHMRVCIMNRFPEMGKITHISGTSGHPQRSKRGTNLAYESLSILTDSVVGVMLALEAERHVPFAHIAVVKYPGLNQWKMSRKDEKIFIRMLTRAAIYGMIAME